jgi:preprotein translocase subunit SecF
MKAHAMAWKGIDVFSHNTNFSFMRWKEWAIGLSILLNVIALLLMWRPGLNYSIDFRGGTLIEVQSKTGPANLGALRESVNKLGLGDVLVQGFANDKDVLLRVALQSGGDKAQAAAVEKIKASLGDNLTFRRIESVGPTVSGELRQIGIIAILASLLGIAIYVWFRFEWQFALGGITALLHDVLLTVGAFCILQFDFDVNVLGALLTIVGYSINDTVVVYDRIRENLRKYKKMPIEELIDKSINEMLSRTIMVSATAFIALLALYFFGPPVIHSFTFALLLGVVVGTYSSIFIAAPILVYFGVKRDWSGTFADTPKSKSKAASGV